VIEILVLLTVLAFKFGLRLEGLSYQWLDDFLKRGEVRLGRYGWAAVVGVFLVGLACLYVRPDITCQYLGRHFADLAMGPFSPDPNNQIPHRVLTPLISYLLGLRGCSITITNIIIAAVFIGSVYDHFRCTSPRPGDAFLAATCMSFSLTVLTVIHCGGYCDVLTYLLIFMMWRHRKRRFLFYLWFLFSLFNHESVVFLLPWLIFISLQNTPGWPKRSLELVVGLTIPLVVYGWFYQAIDTQRNFDYSLGYYLKPLLDNLFIRFRGTLPLHGLGLFSVYQVLWVIPCLAVAHTFKNRKYAILIGLVLTVLCAWPQMFLANDTSRMFTLGFMVMIIALEQLLADNTYRIRQWAFGLVLFNLMVPQLYTAGPIIEVWRSLAFHLALR
jgi:hypothetical protein